jgi:hypothetical protein
LNQQSQLIQSSKSSRDQQKREKQPQLDSNDQVPDILNNQSNLKVASDSFQSMPELELNPQSELQSSNELNHQEELVQTKTKEKLDASDLALLGQNYLFGHGGYTEDLKLAYLFLNQAADQNNASAMYHLSILLRDRLKKNEEGFSYCLRAWQQGYAPASATLAISYAYGHGCQRNEARAREIAPRGSLDIEEEIRKGKKICDFEQKNKLNTRDMLIVERCMRYVGQQTHKKLRSNRNEPDVARAAAFIDTVLFSKREFYICSAAVIAMFVTAYLFCSFWV